MSALKWEGDFVTGTYLEYVRTGVSESGRTQVWEVRGLKTKMKGGEIRWYGPWRQYAFFTTEPDCVWAGRCLTETDEFCKQLTIDHKNRKATLPNETFLPAQLRIKEVGET